MRITSNHLLDYIDQGLGQGHWDQYRPWLWIRRKNASSVSNQLVAPLPGYTRAAHFFAKVERLIALLCLWLGRGRVDVREQYPLWPMPHAHPLADLAATESLPSISGLLDIANDAGIPHGRYVGTSNVPYVATMDLMCTVYTDTDASLHSVSVKPHQLVRSAEPTDRILERHELERRYMENVGGSWVIVDQSITNRAFRANLLLAADAAMHLPLPDTKQIEDFFGVVARCADAGVTESLRLASHLAKYPKHQARRLFFAGLWHHRIDVNLSHNLMGDQPIRLGREQKIQLCTELFGHSL